MVRGWPGPGVQQAAGVLMPGTDGSMAGGCIYSTGFRGSAPGQTLS